MGDYSRVIVSPLLARPGGHPLAFSVVVRKSDFDYLFAFQFNIYSLMFNEHNCMSPGIQNGDASFERHPLRSLRYRSEQVDGRTG